MLSVYLASALTSLKADERAKLFEVSDSIAAECAAAQITLYEPRNYTDPVHNPDIPDSTVYMLDRDRVADCDLLIMVGDYPSTGAGQELILAQQSLIPVVIVAGAGQRLSRMISGMPGVVGVVRYTGQGDLRSGIRSELIKASNRRGPNRQDSRIFAQAITKLRKTTGWSRADLAHAVSGAGVVTESDVESWEESTDKQTNPSMTILSTIAAVANQPLYKFLDV